jgi:hypothetical protein
MIHLGLALGVLTEGARDLAPPEIEVERRGARCVDAEFEPAVERLLAFSQVVLDPPWRVIVELGRSSPSAFTVTIRIQLGLSKPPLRALFTEPPHPASMLVSAFGMQLHAAVTIDGRDRKRLERTALRSSDCHRSIPRPASGARHAWVPAPTTCWSTDGASIEDRPRVDEGLQSVDVPGLYLAGDLTGLPLISAGSFRQVERKTVGLGVDIGEAQVTAQALEFELPCRDIGDEPLTT